jgi:DNA-binding HxlR family transcriptional regulator
MSADTASRIYDLTCSVARTLEHLGERWTFLIIRDAFYGVRRFDEFQEDLGIARNILSKRLASLVDEGILRKERYQDHPMRYEYRLTEKGRDLFPILTAMLAWGDKWQSRGDPPVRLVHEVCGQPMHAVSVCSVCHGSIDPFNVKPDPAPPVGAARRAAAEG